MAAPKFNIPITAEDKTAAGIRSVGKRFEGLAKPVQSLEKATLRFTKGTGFGELIGGFSNFNKTIKDTTSGLAEGAEGFGILGGAAGAAVAGVGILAVALGVGAEKAISFGAKSAATAAGIGRMAQVIGMSTQQMQLFDGAAQQNGDSAEAMNAALNNVGNTLNNAHFGRNNTALALLNQLGIQIPYTKDGMIDVGKATLLLSDAMARNGPQTRQTIAGMFGLNGVINTMISGQAKLQDQIDQTSRTGVVMTDKQIAASTAYNEKVIVLGQSWTALKQDFAQDIVIPWTSPLVDDLSRAVGLIDRLIQGKEDLAGAARRHGSQIAGALLGGITGGPAGAVSGWISGGIADRASLGANQAAIAAWFQSQGWKPAAAQGIAAGMRAENGRLDPGAVNPTSGAYGLGQWLGARKSALFAKYGPNPTALQQLEFMQGEFTGPEGAAGGKIASRSTAHEAMAAYINEFMRPGSGAAGDLARGDDALGLPAGTDAAAANSNTPGAAAQAAIAAAAPPMAGTLPAGERPIGGFIPASGGQLTPASANGQVGVVITLRNAPAGTVAETRTSGDVRASVGIEHSMSTQV